MPTATIRARTKPYPDELRANERICARCAILFTFNPSSGTTKTECRDCLDVEKVKCGTPAGLKAHAKLDEPACDACKEALNERDRNRTRNRTRPKSKTGRTRSPNPSPCGTPGAYTRHRKLGEPIDDACRAANSAAAKERRDKLKENP